MSHSIDLYALSDNDVKVWNEENMKKKGKISRPQTVHFAITGNERLTDFEKKREAKEEKERKMAEARRLRTEKRKQKEEQQHAKCTKASKLTKTNVPTRFSKRMQLTGKSVKYYTSSDISDSSDNE